jgi:hypothetical protein
MYGMKTTAAGSSGGLASITASTGSHIWLLFAAITIFFACNALLQFARKPKAHRP